MPSSTVEGRLTFTFHLLVLLVMAIRVFIPTEVDFSSTSLFKDAAHLVIGGALVYSLTNGKWLLFINVIIVSLFELVLAIVTIN